MLAVLGDLSVLDIILKILFLVVGVLLLVKGADWFVASAASMARRLKVSALIIGLTIVAFGTSAPELAVSIVASLTTSAGETADIAIGNVVGSNIMNIAVVLGLSAVITPMVVKKSLRKNELPFLVLVSFILLFFCFDTIFTSQTSNTIVRTESLVLLGLLVFYVYSSIKNSKEEQILYPNEQVVVEDVPVMKWWLSILLFIVGLAGIVVGADLVTDSAKSLAINIGVACNVDASLMTTLVGLTIVAVGTSLPELVTSVVAARHGQNELALGNIIGSNVFNILFILGVSGSITTLGINSAVLFDLIYMVIIAVVCFVLCYDGKVSKKDGTILLSLYGVYLVYIILRTFIPSLNFFA